MCGGIFDHDVEWDHIVPLRQLVAGVPQQFQAICATCHLEKSTFEGRQDRTLESCFSATAWEWYVKSAGPGALVWTLRKFDEQVAGRALELDVVRCRRNALAHSPCDFSVFCPLDNIEVAKEGELADFS